MKKVISILFIAKNSIDMYLLFNEKEKQKKYADKYGEKLKGSICVTYIPEVYDIQPSVLFNKPIRLSDTAGFGDKKGKEFDEKK